MLLRQLGRYDLIRVLGQGAMGKVYEAHDPNLGRRVAIKTIRVDGLSPADATEYEVRFRVEAHSAARLQHPHIVSVYDADRDGDTNFLVMEFVQGQDLKHHLDQGARYTLGQTLEIMTGLLSALDYAHQRHVLHRDIKPANLLIDQNGSVKLSDFGVARIQDQRATDACATRGTVVGTLKHMSPEQVQGEPIDARADLFGAAIVLYQLLTGLRPFDGDTDFAIIQQIVLHHPAPPSESNPRLPAALDVVMARALAKSRDQRYATAREFNDALLAACNEAEDAKVRPEVSARQLASNGAWSGSWPSVNPAGVSTQTGSDSGATAILQELELVYWKDVKDSDEVEDLHVFLDKFPHGVYADLARRQLRRLKRPAGEDSDVRLQPVQVAPLSAPLAVSAVVATAQVASSPAREPASSSGAWADTVQHDFSDSELESVMVPRPPIGVLAAGLDGLDSLAEGDVGLSAETLAAAARATFSAPTALGAAHAVQGDTAPRRRSKTRALAATAPEAPLPPDLPQVVREARASEARATTRRSAKSQPSRTWAWGGAIVLVLFGLAWLGWWLDRTPSGRVHASATAPAELAGAKLPSLAASEVPALTASAAPTDGMAVPALDAMSLPAPQEAASEPAASPAPVRASVEDVSPALASAKKANNARQRAARPVAPVVRSTKPDDAASASSSAPAAPAAPTERAAGSRVGPAQACSSRRFLAYEVCMSEQCALPGNQAAGVCVDRQAMQKRREDALRQR